MNVYAFKFVLLQKFNEFVADLPEDIPKEEVPEGFDAWFELFLKHLGYSVEEES